MVLRRSAGFFLVAALLLTGCGAGSGSDAKAGENGAGKTSVTVASLRLAGTAPVEVAERKGFFAKEGLDVKLKYVEPAAAVPSVAGGQVQFSVLNAPAVLAAQANNVPVVGVSLISTAAPKPDEYLMRLLTTKIKDLKDLEGRTIAVDTLYQLPDLTLRIALRSRGVDPSRIKFVEIPFPQMKQALTSGRVDAADMSEPFATMAEKEDKSLRSLLSNGEGQDATWPQTVTLASKGYVDANPSVIAAFKRAMNAAVEYTREHPDEARALVPEYTPVSADVADAMKMPHWKTEVSKDGWQKWAEVLKKEGAVKGDIDISSAYRWDN